MRRLEVREVLDRVNLAAPRRERVLGDADPETKHGDVEWLCALAKPRRARVVARAIGDEDDIGLAKRASVSLDDLERAGDRCLDAGPPAAALEEGGPSLPKQSSRTVGVVRSTRALSRGAPDASAITKPRACAYSRNPSTIFGSVGSAFATMALVLSGMSAWKTRPKNPPDGLARLDGRLGRLTEDRVDEPVPREDRCEVQARNPRHLSKKSGPQPQDFLDLHHRDLSKRHRRLPSVVGRSVAAWSCR